MPKPQRKRVALYVRVSTEDQDLARQERDLRALAKSREWEVVHVFAEKVSGASTSRPQFQAMRHAAALRRFAAVLVWGIDRLGRSTIEVLSVAKELHDRGVGLVSLTEPEVDTTTDLGNFVLGLMSVFAQLERAVLGRRTSSGIQARIAKGQQWGRPPVAASPGQVDYLLKVPGATQAAVAKQLGCSVRTVRRRQRAADAAKKGGGAAATAPRGNPDV